MILDQQCCIPDDGGVDDGDETVVKKRSSPKLKIVHSVPGPRAEELWVREFIGFYGTRNIVRFRADLLGGVSLTRIIEALSRGALLQSEKLDEPGVECLFEHASDDDTVEVVIRFEANVMRLEIVEANFVKETDGEPDAA